MDYFGLILHSLFWCVAVDRCKVVASSNVPCPLFQSHSDMKFGVQKPYRQCKNTWECIETFAAVK